MKILIAHTSPEDFRNDLLSRFPDDDIHFTDRPDELVADLARHQPEAVFTIKQKSFPPQYHPAIPSCPSVRWIQVGGSGYEHIGRWDADRTRVTNCAGVLARFLAETVTGAMITLNNNTFTFRDQQREKVWQTHLFRPLVGQTLLIVGLGHIGGWLAHNAKALGMHVIAIRNSDTPHPSVDEMYRPDALKELVGRADVVSLHVRHTPQTEGMVNAEVIANMRPGSMLINTSRGPVVDEPALLDGLRSGQIGSAYLDVFNTEPLPTEHPFWGMDNVLLTPHASDHVHEWPAIFGRFFGDNLELYKVNKPLNNEVSPS